MTSLDTLNADFRDMVQCLADEGAQFLMIGAYAVSFHGHPRTTGDMDLWVRPDPQNARKVWRALSKFGAPANALGITEQDLARENMVVQFGVPPRRIDLVTSISGVSFDEGWQSRVEVTWSGRRIAFLGLDALLANKRATGRPKDLLDVTELERIRSKRKPGN